MKNKSSFVSKYEEKFSTTVIEQVQNELYNKIISPFGSKGATKNVLKND